MNTFLAANVLNYSHGIKRNKQLGDLCVLWKIMQLRGRAERRYFGGDEVTETRNHSSFYRGPAELVATKPRGRRMGQPRK
ncbi:hypothetical protein J4Q44_G00248880 [Coregonus suidteri]|uniref:Uncharacterized protein n=1 Tax=Coregonus suidteri TaxID=861788 RepID=A0AAN8LA37_9TELE